MCIKYHYWCAALPLCASQHLSHRSRAYSIEHLFAAALPCAPVQMVLLPCVVSGEHQVKLGQLCLKNKAAAVELHVTVV